MRCCSEFRVQADCGASCQEGLLENPSAFKPHLELEHSVKKNITEDSCTGRNAHQVHYVIFYTFSGMINATDIPPPCVSFPQQLLTHSDTPCDSFVQSWWQQILWDVYRVLQHTQCKGPSLCTLIYPAVKSCIVPGQTTYISSRLSLWLARRYIITLRLLMLRWQTQTVTSGMWLVLMKALLQLTEVDSMNGVVW